MNGRIALATIVVLGSLAAPACAGRVVHRQTTLVTTVSHIPPGAGAAVGMFYDDLAPYGVWVRVEGPGWVWRPAGVPAGWRPYALGRWVYTDYGWTWVAEERWGWAVYHYGRWHHAPQHGWVWVPGTEWGPAWVTWHSGGGWIGWAPLPWQVSWRAGVGLDWGRVDVRVAIEPAWWCFLPARHLTDPTPARHFASRDRVPSLIRITNNVTNYTIVDNRVFNQGVSVQAVGRAAGRPVPRLRVRETDAPRAATAPVLQGDEVLVFRPGAHASPQRGASPARAPRPSREAPAVPAGRMRTPRRPDGSRPVRPDDPALPEEGVMPQEPGRQDAADRQDEAGRQDDAVRDESAERGTSRGPRVPEPARSRAEDQTPKRPVPGRPGRPSQGPAAVPPGAAAAPQGPAAAPAASGDEAGRSRGPAEGARPQASAPRSGAAKPGTPAGKGAAAKTRKPAKKKDDAGPGKKAGSPPKDAKAEEPPADDAAGDDD
jgi:hypothetical protein